MRVKVWTKARPGSVIVAGNLSGCYLGDFLVNPRGPVCSVEGA